MTARNGNVPTNMKVTLIDMTQELEITAVLSRHSFLAAVPAAPMRIIVEDDDGNFCIPVPESASCEKEVSTSDIDHEDASVPLVAEVDPFPRTPPVLSVSSHTNDENVPLGPLGPKGPLGPLGTLDPANDHPELVTQSAWIPPRVVPEARCCLMNADGLCSKCAPGDPEEVPRHLLPSDEIHGKPDIQDRYASAADAKRATQLHSYHQACACQQDYKKSGGRRKIYVCTTADKQEIDGEAKITDCAYKTIWRLSKKGGITSWVLNRKNSHLRHATACQSEPRMTEDMLVHNPQFVGSIINRSKSTIKQLFRDGLTAGVTNKSMSKRSLYRARDRLFCHLAADYTHHFDWMETWAKTFCDVNPGSAYDIDRDEEGR